MADFKTKTMKRKNVKGLALSAPPPRASTPSSGDAQIPGAIGNQREDRGDTLEIGVEFRLDLRAEDLIVIKELGAGNGGTVSKVQHAATKVIMARKIIHVEAKKEVRKRIVRELQIMHECNSPYIVSFYGAFMNEVGDVIMCMEYMDVGSLDSISKNFGPVRVDILGKIAESVLGGLTYLYRAHRIMHRDIKPSNILVNSKGYIKLCDFGVSSELEGSVAETFVGTGTYMAPERIQGSAYTVKSDVWSVGLTLMELAIGKFPFSAGGDDDEHGGPQGILDLLQAIVMEPSPKLPQSDAFPQILHDMVEKCLLKDPKERPTPQELFEHDSFIQAAKRTPVNLEAWAVSMMERHNRKSHLAPQLSPTTRALLRDGTNLNTPDTSKTPSSTQAAYPTGLSTKTPTTATYVEDGRAREVDVDALPFEMDNLSLQQQKAQQAANGYPSNGYDDYEPSPPAAQDYQQYPAQYSYNSQAQGGYPYEQQYSGSREQSPYSASRERDQRPNFPTRGSSSNVPVHPAYRQDLSRPAPPPRSESANWMGRERRVGFEGQGV